MAGQPPDIELRAVSKAYGPVLAVDSVSLAIAKGEFFSLLGPSGCGKTTLLRMIAGFVTPTRGEVVIRGEVANGIPPYRRHTNMVFQQLALFPHLKVFDNVAFGLVIRRRPRREIEQRVHRILEQVGLVGFDQRRPHELSGGQQQRVALARALVGEPTALLLDEPLGALDLKLRGQMQLELKRIQKRLGTTFVYVTHDQGEAMTMSDRIAVMRSGRIEQVGSAEQVYLQPKTRFVADFIGETNLFDGVVVEASGGVATVESDGMRLRMRGRAEPGKRVVLSLRPESVEVRPRNGPIADGYAATIESALFLGPVLRCDLRLENGRKIVADLRAGSGAGLQVDQQAWVSWSPDHLVLLEQDGGGVS